MGILSRAFCNTTVNRDYENIESIFKEGMQKLRSYESFLKNCDESYFNTTHRKLCECVKNIVGSLVGLIVLSPLMLLVALAIKLDSKGPVLFKQTRLGKDAKEFQIYKFRSMCQGAEQMGTGQYSFSGDSRITKVGKFIRATSIDELPQFINILKGEMSLVGFRPPLTYHPWPVEEYTEEQLRMFEVQPGITGWAQVHGRKDVEWHRRINLNIWYVDHISLALDIKILLMTVVKVLKNEDNENVTVTVRGTAADENAVVEEDTQMATRV